MNKIIKITIVLLIVIYALTTAECLPYIIDRPVKCAIYNEGESNKQIRQVHLKEIAKQRLQHAANIQEHAKLVEKAKTINKQIDAELEKIRIILEL